MKILTALLFAAACHAQTVSLPIPLSWIAHLKVSFRAMTPTVALGILSSVTLESANSVDYITTSRAIFPGSPTYNHYCEQNAFLRNGQPCHIDAARFTGVKIGVAAFDFATWVPIWIGKVRPDGTYAAAVTVIRFAGSIPLVAADVNNINQLLNH